MEEMKELRRREGFVKREDSARLAQSEDCCKTPEEINLIAKIHKCTNEILGGLNSVQSLIISVNKNLLPSKLKDQSDAKVEAKQPQGWLEIHLEYLQLIYRRSMQIYEEVQRLNGETKINKVGQ